MLHVEREILEMTDQAGIRGPTLPAPPLIADVVDRLIKCQLLEVGVPLKRRLSITEKGRAALLR